MCDGERAGDTGCCVSRSLRTLRLIWVTCCWWAATAGTTDTTRFDLFAQAIAHLFRFFFLVCQSPEKNTHKTLYHENCDESRIYEIKILRKKNTRTHTQRINVNSRARTHRNSPYMVNNNKMKMYICGFGDVFRRRQQQ